MCNCENGCNHMSDGTSYLSPEEKNALKSHPSICKMGLSDKELDDIIHTIDQTYWCHLGVLFSNPEDIFETELDNGNIGIIPDIITTKNWMEFHNRDFVPDMAIIMSAQEQIKKVFVPAVLRVISN